MFWKWGKRIGFSLLSLALISLLGGAIARPYRISGDCMEPTLIEGQLCFLNRILPCLRQYKIGDKILFKHDGNVWVSRVVALDTDVIQIAEGTILVNGGALLDAEIRRNWSGWSQGTYAIDKPFQVPTDHVYVLSDNLSANHDDSRVFGPIPSTSILGLVW